MATTAATDYCCQVAYVCSSNATRSRRRLTTTKKCSQNGYSLFVFVIIALTFFAQMPERSTAATLTQQADTESVSLEFAEDTLNLLHELERLVQQEHKVGPAVDVDNGHGYLGSVKRLRKRHNSIEKSVATSDDKPEWQNVCGSQSGWSGDEVSENLSNDYIQLYMKNLRKSVRLEYKALKTSGMHDIDIDDMKAWRRYERKYKFLPTLENNSAIAPVCWHQSMQKFIASFTYLHNIQQHWDKQNLHANSGVARELHILLQSSKRILCEIETTIKGSYPRDKLQLTAFTRDEMLAILNFYTRSDQNSTLHGQRGVNHTDVRFVKFFYQNYLLRLWKSLLRHSKNINLQYGCDKSTHPMIVDTSLDTEASITHSKMHGDVED